MSDAIYDRDVRDLPDAQADHARRVFEVLRRFHGELVSIQAPVWLAQSVNSMSEDYRQSLDRVRPYRPREYATVVEAGPDWTEA